MDRQQFIIGCLIGVLIAGGVVWWFLNAHKQAKPVSMVPNQTGTSTYVLLSDQNTGTTTTRFPVTIIIQLPATDYSTSTVTVADPDHILTDRQVQSYKTYTIVNGTVHGPGMIMIGPRPLSFTFTNESY